MRLTDIVIMCCLVVSQAAVAHGPMPMPLQRVPVPPVPGLTDGPNPIVVDKNKAIALGKALFWDVNVGSDGMACGSCHFHAGADSRVKNQINPGQKSTQPSGQTFEALPTGLGGPNHELSVADFPLRRYSDPLNSASQVTFNSDDVVSSAGTFSGTFISASQFSGNNDQCGRGADPVFHVNGIGTRRVEPRNAPTVINAVFNHRNFWDGRANNVFNGSSPWGDRDPTAGVWEKVNARNVQKSRLHLVNSSLASLAVAPPLSDSEMGCRQRVWPDIGRKLLLRQPLQNQKVHNEDSVLGPYSLSSAGNLRPGLNTTYKALIKQAFNQKYWSYSGIGPFGGRQGQAPYDQMEANFSMFFGIALQLYQGTLISDQAPIDLTARDPDSLEPIWTNLGYDQEKIDTLTRGFEAFTGNHCQLCHGGPTLSIAAVATNASLVTPTPGMNYGPLSQPIPYGPNAIGDGDGGRIGGITPAANVVTRDTTRNGATSYYKLMDLGFANTGVADPDSDVGVDGADDFGNPLSFTKQYVQYLLDNPAGVLDSGVSTLQACDFIKALADNAIPFSRWFGVADGIIADGSKEGLLRNQNCTVASSAYIPTAAAALANLTTEKMSIATKAAFKVPTLRNIELTGPYMHNGSMSTLEQVLEFYSRKGNFNNDNKHIVVNQIALSGQPASIRADLIEFLKTLTDERVRYDKAPFDHPEIVVPHGHAGDNVAVTPGNPLNSNLAIEETMTIPAVGANGLQDPIRPFDTYLAP
ncbi:cytochrome c peroxidase [Methylomonas sp. BW4-1]|uniref:cytochrome c peroxidase n=1 Tax=Methylomonas sp. BW4-1 TaxID=3376685 RepID=UPI0040416AC7